MIYVKKKIISHLYIQWVYSEIRRVKIGLKVQIEVKMSDQRVYCIFRYTNSYKSFLYKLVFVKFWYKILNDVPKENVLFIQIKYRI